MLDARVRQHPRPLIAGQRTDSRLQRSAVEQECAPRATGEGDEGIHDPGAGPDEVVLHPAAQPGSVGQRHPCSLGMHHRQGRGHLQRRRGAQAGADRDGAGGGQLKAGDALVAQRSGDADHVIAPAALPLGRQAVELQACLRLVAHHLDGSSRAGTKGDRHIAVDRRRQNEPVVVVRVLADDVDPSRRGDDGRRVRVERLPEQILGALRERFRRGHDRWLKIQARASSAVSTDGSGASVCPLRSNRQVRSPTTGRPMRMASAISDSVP